MTNSFPTPEKTTLTVGYMPLSDSLPLIAAQELGYFQQQGLDVKLQQEVSWANIRDKLLVGHFDAAQMLAPMLLASHLGLGGLKKSMLAPMSLALNGNALTISNALAQRLSDQTGLDELYTDSNKAGAAMADIIDQNKRDGRDKLVFAVVFPFSVHNLMLRDWLASAGINPDDDVQLVVLPPSQMVEHLQQQHIDGFFAGAPWNSVAIQQGVGQCLLAGPDLWDEAPDKVLGVTQDWSQQHPNTLSAVIRAIKAGCQWAAENPQAGAELLSQHLDLPLECLLPALSGHFVYRNEQPPRYIADMLVFTPERACAAQQQHATWFLQQMQRWGWLPQSSNIADIASQCYRDPAQSL